METAQEIKIKDLTLHEAVASGRPFRRQNYGHQAKWYKYDTDEGEIYDIEDSQKTASMINIKDALYANWEIRMSDTFSRGEVEIMIRQGANQAFNQNLKACDTPQREVFHLAGEIAKQIMGFH